MRSSPTPSPRASADGPRPDLPLRRAATEGGLPRLFRARFPDRQEERPALSRRAQSAGHRGELDDQPCRLRPCRSAAVHAASAGVQRRRFRVRHRGPERPLVRTRTTSIPGARWSSSTSRTASTCWRAPRRPASGSCCTTRQVEYCPLRLSSACRGKRARGLLPAHQRPGRFSLQGRRSRHPHHPRPSHDQGFQAQRRAPIAGSTGITSQFVGRPIAPAMPAEALPTAPSSFKIL